ncbi:hypothetical protein Lal_00006296 [Lupinus albus]|uniref:DUF4057 domain-containing protein n=1 Tax=Lupinus albus TaxID=3870 RepID=A0A6A5MMP6_LUPAL|nr:hypothetical protein Lalb_Chr07g0185161 [Lupinus albus]KAF1875666.1 hypothetical protein Lal_00006296 [Lupinus albus]
MQRNTLLRNPRPSTSDLLTWPEFPSPEPPSVVPASGNRSRQPSGKIGEVLGGAKLSDEKEESPVKKKTCPWDKMKEMTGNGIFSANAEDTSSQANSANSKNKTSMHAYQEAINGISRISFITEESTSLKKSTSIPEVAKQRELSQTFRETDAKGKKQISSAKTKELSGNGIFGPIPEILPHPFAAACTSESKESKEVRGPDPRNVHTSVKVSNLDGGQSDILYALESVKTSKRIHEQKFTGLTGNNIFKRDVRPGSAQKLLSRAKLREITGSDIFADGKAENRDFILGARRHHGGGSDIFADGKAENRDSILGARRHHGGGSDIFADGKAENRDSILGACRPPNGGSDIFADGKAEKRASILGAWRHPGGGSDIFADGKAENRDRILGVRRPPNGGSDIFADGKAENRDSILGARRPPGGGSDIFADRKAENKDSILGPRRPPNGGSDIFADGTAENRDSILGARRPRNSGSDIFTDGKAENRDSILGARRPHNSGSDIFADGKAENRDSILGARRPPGSGNSIIFTDGKAENRDILGARRPPGGRSSITLV